MSVERGATTIEKTRYSAALWIVVASLLFFAGAILLRSGVPSLGDYGEWTYHGVLLRDVLQGHANAAYALKTYPVPNSLTVVGLGVLMLVMPWKIAMKVWLLGELGLGLVCMLQLQRASGRMQGWRLVVLAGAMLLGTTFWFGFTNFMFGIYFAMLLCSMLLRGVESRWKYTVLLLLVFFCHMIPFGFAVLVLGLYAAQTGRWKVLWQTVPALAMTVWYFAGRLAHGNADGRAGMVASAPYMTGQFLLYKVNSYLKCWGFVNPALRAEDSVLLRVVGVKVFVLLFVLNAIVALGVLGLLGFEAWRAIRDRTPRRFFWVAVGGFFLVSLLMPGAMAGISDPGGRMLQVAVWCGVCLVVARGRWAGEVLGGCAFVLLAVNCWMLQTVAMEAPMAGSMGGRIPAHVRQFAHVYYSSKDDFLSDLETGQREREIFPTALFLKR